MCNTLLQKYFIFWGRSLLYLSVFVIIFNTRQRFRKLIYTTNRVEWMHRQFRKLTITKGALHFIYMKLSQYCLNLCFLYALISSIVLNSDFIFFITLFREILLFFLKIQTLLTRHFSNTRP